MADDEKSEIEQKALNTFSEGGYAKAINNNSVGISRGDVHKVKKKINLSDGHALEPMLLLSNSAFGHNPLDFKPCNKNEYLKCQMMRSLE